jgi:signal transduction histidine kinase
MLRVSQETTPPASATAYVVIADADKLQQVVLNLLINAARFTPVAGRVRVRCAPLPGDQSRIAILVGESGLDIPGDDSDAILEPFVPMGRSPSGHGEGTGLGLAISRDLARGMGGSLKVESVAVGGAVFTLVLPRG